MPDLKITSFNSHAGLQTRRDGVCPPYDLETVLHDFDADVVVLQESWTPDGGTSAVRRVAEAIDAHVFELPFGRARLEPWPHVPRDGIGSGTVGLAILSRIPAELRGRLEVGTVPNDPTPERGGLHVALDVEGTEVDLVGIHLTSRLPYGPPTQMRRLRPQLPNGGRPTIVAGDYNFWGPGVTALLPGWRRAVRGRTWPARRPHSQIDHILVRRDDGMDVVDHAVLPEVGSDHRPVRATLRVGRDGAEPCPEGGTAQRNRPLS
jgi:endonuclease/exonuclease/phosphatase family metal-dependent hydrolase